MTNLEKVIENNKRGCYSANGYLIELLKVALREDAADVKRCLSESELVKFKAFLRLAQRPEVHVFVAGGRTNRLEMKQQIAALSDELELV